MCLAIVITHKWLLQLFKCSLRHLIINYQAVQPQKLNFPTLAACIKKRERELQQSNARVPLPWQS